MGLVAARGLTGRGAPTRSGGLLARGAGRFGAGRVFTQGWRNACGLFTGARPPSWGGRTRRAADFSLPTLLMLEAGIGLWTIYGMMRAAPLVWLGNGVTLALAAFNLSVKLRRAQPTSN